MTGGFSFWDIEVWSFIITISLLLGAMMLANVFLKKIPFLKKSLIPASVLGGFIILLADAGFRRIFGRSMFDLKVLESLTYHGLGLGFVALAWRHLDGVKGKEARKDVFNTSTITVGGYLLQGVAGLAITIVLSKLVGCFAAGGAILPMGYGQGPGQAFNWGTIYEQQNGFQYGSSFGLTVAALGFVSACVGGVFRLDRMRREGNPKASVPEEGFKEDLSAERITGGNEIPVSETMDKLTVQFALVFGTYLIAFASMWLLYRFVFLPSDSNLLLNTVNPLIWGFNFLIGTAWAILFKGVGDGLRKKGIMKRSYTNNFMLNRISGLMFDLMVVASIAAIDLSAFSHAEFIIPLLLLCTVGALITYLYCKWQCTRLFPGYSDEMFLAMYGMLTGTASTGIILLREIDPLFKTPASHNLIYQNLWSIVLGAPMLLIMSSIPGAEGKSLLILTALFAFILALQFRDGIKKIIRK